MLFDKLPYKYYKCIASIEPGGFLGILHVLLSAKVSISKNGYPISDNRTLNCEGVAPFISKDVKLQWGTLSNLHNVLLSQKSSTVKGY